jgi:hypothetical protein
MATVKQTNGTIASVLTTELNSMANNALVLSSAVSLSETGYLECDVEVYCTFGVAPTSNTGFSIWFLKVIDGTNYEDGGTSVTPGRAPDIVIPVRAVTTAQRIINFGFLPPGNFKVLIKNDATGQALASSGNTLKIIPRTYTVV